MVPLLFNRQTLKEGDVYVYIPSVSKINRFQFGISFIESPTANVNFYNWPRPYQWADRGDSVHMSFRVILFDCITGRNLNGIHFHHHLSLRKFEPKVISQWEWKWKEKSFLCEKICTFFKGLHMSVKIIPEHSSLKGSNCIQVSFCCENTNMKLMGKFSGICCQWFRIRFSAKMLQNKDNDCF